MHIAFGLRWLCDVCWPELPSVNDDGPPDVQLRVRTWPSIDEDADAVLWYGSAARGEGSWRKVFRISQGEFFLVRYSDGTDFLIHRSGSQIWCRWDPRFSLAHVATYLYGPIMGFLLRLRGVVCLHASVVGIEDRAVAFVGPGRAGKSTLAAAWAARGFPALSDDILALEETGGVFQALSTYPRLRLWPESVDALFGSPEALPRINEGWDKRHLELTPDRFEARHRPLGAIYVLGERQDTCEGPRIQALRGAESLPWLIANTYSYHIFDKAMRAREFTMLSRLASQVPIRSLVPFPDLARIGQLCDLVYSDFQAHPRPERGQRQEGLPSSCIPSAATPR